MNEKINAVCAFLLNMGVNIDFAPFSDGTFQISAKINEHFSIVEFDDDLNGMIISLNGGVKNISKYFSEIWKIANDIMNFEHENFDIGFDFFTLQIGGTNKNLMYIQFQL